MSKPIKALMRKELSKQFDGMTSLAVVGFTGVDAISTNQIRERLRSKGIRLTVVKNAMARQAFKDIGLEAAGALLDGPCAIAYGSDSVVSVVRELLEEGKDQPNLTVKAALMEGETFGADQIQALSKFPTRDEAIATVVACVLSPAGKLVGAIRGPASKIASLIKTIEEKASESDSEADAA